MIKTYDEVVEEIEAADIWAVMVWIEDFACPCPHITKDEALRAVKYHHRLGGKFHEKNWWSTIIEHTGQKMFWIRSKI